MIQIVTGLLLGVTASLIAGLLLIWKGDKFVGYFRRLPERRRIALFTSAYILGLRGYPYRFVHTYALMSLGMFVFTVLIAYSFMTAASFRRVYFPGAYPILEPETLRETVLSDAVYLPWTLLAFTLLFFFLTVRGIFRKLIPEMLAPYGYHEMLRVHDCVAKFGTKSQYLNYINAAQKVRDNAGLLKLLDVAQAAIGEPKYELLDEIRRGVTPDAARNETS